MNRWHIGKTTVTRVIESCQPSDPDLMVSMGTPENLAPYFDWLQPHFVDDEGRMLLSIHAYIIESEGMRILIDTCVGNDKTSPLADWHQQQYAFLDDLTAAGYPRESIDVVVCTHLHPDHVGWNTMLNDGKWVPTFPNASYLMNEDEVTRFGRSQHEMLAPMMQESVMPVLDAGLHTYVTCDHAITDEVQLIPTPGHTPNHVSVVIDSGDDIAVITGDLMHSPVQCARPEWGNPADWRPHVAEETRRTFCNRFADAPVLIFGTHFATPSTGYIKSGKDNWMFSADAHAHRGT